VTGKIHFSANEPLRPIWRFVISALIVFVAYLSVGIILGIIFNLLHLEPNLLLVLFLANLLMLAALLGIYKMLCTLLDDKPLAFVGLGFRGRWKAELARGFALGAIMVLAVAALERAFGLANFFLMPQAAATEQQVLMWAFFSLILFSVAGTAEELTFRGYPFQRLADSLGPAAAVAVFAALFGAAHLGNSSHTWISTCNTMLVGVAFAVAYLRTRSLWLPVGLHVSWNIVQGFALGFPVSGILLPVALVRPEYHGADWLTGGSYGPEGSLLATGVIVLGTVYLLLSKSIYVSKEMRVLVFAPPAMTPNKAESGVAVGPSGGGETGFPSV
jgi:membrane protease YdiL (CAAX protease family)